MPPTYLVKSGPAQLRAAWLISSASATAVSSFPTTRLSASLTTSPPREWLADPDGLESLATVNVPHAQSQAGSGELQAAAAMAARIREEIPAAWTARFQRSPAAVSVRSSLSTQSETALPYRRRRARAEDSSALSAKMTSSTASWCRFPQAQSNLAALPMRAFISSRNG